MFAIGTDTFLISPLLPTLRHLYGVSTGLSGWMMSAYALGYALFALIAGPISDYSNRKTVMIGGMAAFALATFFCGLASNFWMMCLFRLIAGISAAFVSPQVWAAIPALVPQDKIIKKSIGSASAGLAVAQLLGLPFGSCLASFTWRAPFFILSLLSALLLTFAVFLLPPLPAAQAGSKPSIAGRYKDLFGTHGASSAFLAYLLFQMGNFASFTFLGTWFADAFQLNVSQIGLALLVVGLGNLMGSSIGNRCIGKLGTAKSLFVGLIAMGAFYFALPFFGSLTFVEIALFLAFFVAGAIFPPLMMSLLQSLSPSSRGTISALANSVMYVGVTVGALVAGQLYSLFAGFISVTAFTLIMCILASGFF
ncbi:MFS transporter [Terrilactibacillus sp. S3-3]|nr:MFS transporter [Terrilactibacillus sp. S3-3]